MPEEKTIRGDIDLSVPHTVPSSDVSLEDRTLLLLARLMEGGQEDEDTCKDLNTLTKTLSDETVSSKAAGSHRPLFQLIDSDSVETIMGYLDMRQSQSVRGHAVLTTSAYLKASGARGVQYLTEFFQSRVGKGTYDDFILAFSVAALIFPVVPDVAASLFLSDGFVISLGPLMKRNWKSKKVEQATLDMLNAACMNTACREAIQKYCTEWLEEIVAESSTEQHHVTEDEPTSQTHSETVRNLAAVVLAKLQAIPRTSNADSSERITPATTSIEDLSNMFKTMLSSDSSRQNSIEGLAYASLQSSVKEKLTSDEPFLKNLIKALGEAPAKSPMTYGALSILLNLTTYMPALSEEQKRMTELKAYANAAPSAKPDPLNDDEHVTKRCLKVFEAGAIPVLVTHSQHGSPASLTVVVRILFSLSKTPKIRGQMAQQGAVKLLLHAYNSFPTDNVPARRTAAHALARILISTNPTHVFGGSTPLPLTSAIRPLLTLLSDEDPSTDQRDLLPIFESLLALTNLASTDDSARTPIIRTSFTHLTELLLHSNPLITRATVELLCNLMLSPDCVSKFADGTKPASDRLNILLALADSPDLATRRAAGGALASLSEWDTAVNAILERERGVSILLALCGEESEELRHRGVVCVLNVLTAPGKVGEWGRNKVSEAKGAEALKECARKSRSQEVLEVTVEALKVLLGESEKKSENGGGSAGGNRLLEN